MNHRNKLIGLLAAGVLAAAALVAGFTYRSVYAQTPTQTPTQTPATPGTQTQPQPPAAGWGDRHGGPRGGYADADVAAALGITTEQYQAAVTTANTEALKEAVSQGLLTQAQADELAANGLAGREFHGFGLKGAASTIDYNALLAKALGITTDQLKAGFTKALNTSLDNAVAAGTMTQAQADEIKGSQALANDTAFQTAMKTAYEAALKQAVDSGVITQAQADAILARQAQAGGGFFGPGGFGRGGGRGHHGFGGDNTAPAAPQNNSNGVTLPAPSTNGL